MTETAEQDRQVENGMIKFYFFNAVYNGTGGISDTAGEKPEQTRGRQIVDQRFYRKNDNPTHEYIHKGG
mgnify:CR=1 FL=1